MFNFKNKIVAVTGGGSGIGKAICETFAKQEATVYVLDITENAAQETLNSIAKQNNKAHAITCNVSDHTSVKKAFKKISNEHGRIDVLVNSAGISAVGNIEATNEEELDRVYDVNVKGVYNCALEAIKIMKENNGGCIINMASIASHVGISDRFVYSMTKGAVLTMTLSIAHDYLKEGIRCNCISPARVHTPFVDNFLKKNYPGKEQEVFQTLSDYQPMGRMGKPEEIAALALFLASDEASFITACSYAADGGVLNLR